MVGISAAWVNKAKFQIAYNMDYIFDVKNGPRSLVHREWDISSDLLRSDGDVGGGGGWLDQNQLYGTLGAISWRILCEDHIEKEKCSMMGQQFWGCIVISVAEAI